MDISAKHVGESVPPPSIRQGLHDLHHGLELELERVEALLAVPWAGDDSEAWNMYGTRRLNRLLHTPTDAPLSAGSPVGDSQGKAGPGALLELAPPRKPGVPQEPLAAGRTVLMSSQMLEPPMLQTARSPTDISVRGDLAESKVSATFQNLLASPRQMLDIPSPRMQSKTKVSEGLLNLLESPPTTCHGSSLELPSSRQTSKARPQLSDASFGGLSISPQITASPQEVPVIVRAASPRLEERGNRFQRLVSPPHSVSSTSSVIDLKHSQTSGFQEQISKLRGKKDMKSKSWLRSKASKGAMDWQSAEAAHLARSAEMEKKKRAMTSEFESEPTLSAEPMRFCQKLFRHQYVEMLFASAILVSALVYAAEVQYMAHHLGAPQPTIFFALHQFFTGLFLFELCLNIWIEGCRRFVCAPETRVWAWLDIAICSASILESSLDVLLLMANDDEQFLSVGSLRIVRMTRVLRISRALRLQRFIRLVSSLRTLVYSIAVTLKSLFWAMVLLLLIVFVFAMCITQFTIEYAVDPQADPAASLELQRYWGTLDRSMFTLFQSIAGGISWREAVMPMERVSLVLVVLLVIYISFVYFAVLNVVTGVFCSSAIETAHRTPELIARSLIDNKRFYEDELRKLFRNIDRAGTGWITLADFESLRNDEMTHAYFRALEIDFNDAWTIFKLMDEDKGGAVEINEFVRGCQQLRGAASSLEIQDMAYDLRKLNDILVDFAGKTDQRFEALAKKLPEE